MSGGSLNYIQHVDTEDLIQSEGRHEELQWIVETLVPYGDLSIDARNATASALAKVKEAHDAYLKLIREVDAIVDPLRSVWRQLDYCGSNDVSRDDVCKELETYNRTHGKRS